VNPADLRIIGGTAFTNQVPNVIFLIQRIGLQTPGELYCSKCQRGIAVALQQ